MELKGVKIVPLLPIREHAYEYMYIHIIQTYKVYYRLTFPSIKGDVHASAKSFG